MTSPPPDATKPDDDSGGIDWLRVGADAEQLATRILQESQRRIGVQRPMTVRPYRGFVADGVAHVRARVQDEPRFEAAAESLSIDSTLAANLLRWVVLDRPGVTVDVSMRDVAQTAVSDQDGFVTVRLPVGDVEPGWHPVDLVAHDGEREVRAQGRVVQPDPASQIAVISDIDDTILRTGMTEGLRSIRRTLLRDAHGRKPIPGTPSLYRGLARGLGRRPESTFFYVSAAPWNLYEVLTQFLAIRGFPRGPLFLTDWRPGPGARGGIGKAGHKRARIRRLVDAYPDLRFLLLGDDGEADPQVYEQFLSSDPDRVVAALVRSVHGHATTLPPGLPPEPHAVITSPDALHMAQVAERLGLIDGLTVEEVQTEMGARL